MRYTLGMQFEHCARLLIENPKYRGVVEGEIIESDLDRMAEKHGLQALLAETRRKEREAAERKALGEREEREKVEQQERARRDILERQERKAAEQQRLAQQQSLPASPEPAGIDAMVAAPSAAAPQSQAQVSAQAARVVNPVGEVAARLGAVEQALNVLADANRAAELPPPSLASDYSDDLHFLRSYSQAARPDTIRLGSDRSTRSRCY